MKRENFLNILLLLAFCFINSGCPGGDKKPPELEFAIKPQATCAARPGAITGRYSSNGDLVNADVLDAGGNVIKHFENLPPSSDSALQFVPTGITAGTYTIRLEAKFNDGGTTTKTQNFTLVDENGFWFSHISNTFCEAAECQGFGSRFNMTDDLLDVQTLTIKDVRLSGFSTSSSDFEVKLSDFQVEKLPGSVSVCNTGSSCSNLPAEKPAHPLWVSNPLGVYNLNGLLTKRVIKQTRFDYTVEFKFVCK